MAGELKDHTLEFLLAFDGLIHWLENGYSLRFVIKKVNQPPTRPHGLDYSFTLHDGEGKRILGFDNAHPVRRPSGKYKKKAATAIIGIGPQPTRAGRTNSSMPTRSWRTFSRKSIASSKSGRFPPMF